VKTSNVCELDFQKFSTIFQMFVKYNKAINGNEKNIKERRGFSKATMITFMSHHNKRLGLILKTYVFRKIIFLNTKHEAMNLTC